MKILISHKHKTCFRLLLIVLFLIMLIPSSGFSSDDEEKQSSRADSISILRREYSATTTAEDIASLPGYLAYAPLKFTFEIQKFIIQQALATKVIEANFIAKFLGIFISDDGKRGILPTYSSSAGGGLKFYQKGLFTDYSKLSLSATWGLRERHRYRFRIKNIEFGKQVTAGLIVQYHFQSDESFFGIGPSTDIDDRTNYAHELLSADLDIGIRLGANNRIGMMAGYERSDILKGRNKKYPSTTDVAAFSFLPGMESVVGMGKLEMEIQHDSKNHPARPTSGFEAFLRGSIYQQLDNDQYGFSRIRVDISRYFELFYFRTLKLRIGGEFTDPLKNRQIPFYYLSEMGRSETVRGFNRGRFRDKDMVLGSVEYIYPIWEKINAYFFLDAGTVSNNIVDDFDVDNLKYGYGTGFRFWNAEEVITDFSVAHSRDGFRFYLELNVSL